MLKNVMIIMILLLSIGSVFGSLGVSVENMQTHKGADIFFPHMLRGGYAETWIHASTGDDEPITCKIHANGAIKDWIHFEPGTELTVDNRGTTAIKVIVEPPLDTANGIYNGTITVESAGSGSGDGSYSMGVSTAIALKVQVEVTGEQIVSFVVNKISISDGEEGGIIPIKLSVKNTGNVEVEPVVKINVLDLNETSIIKTFELSGKSVEPSVTKELIYSFSAESFKLGQYWADIEVYSGETLVKSSKETFDVLEKGALKTSGELIKISNDVWAKPQQIQKITAVFKNTGETLVSAKFKGEVRLNNDLITLIESDGLSVSPGETVNFDSYFTPEKPGRYTISGYVLYGQKKSLTKESIINVNGDLGISMSPVTIGIGALAIAGISVALVFGIRKGFRKKDWTE